LRALTGGGYKANTVVQRMRPAAEARDEHDAERATHRCHFAASIGREARAPLDYKIRLYLCNLLSVWITGIRAEL
jgi:hypothetical protein